MSYLERLENRVNIITGDGKSFDLDCLKIGISPRHEYNSSVFIFPAKEGSYVDRWLPKGTRYDLEVIFHGTNHLEEAKDFINSARDRRAWKLTHPYYDTLTVQPMGIVNKDDFSTSKLEITLLETIELSVTDIATTAKKVENAINDLNTGLFLMYNTIPTLGERNSIEGLMDTIVGETSTISSSIIDYTSNVSTALNTVRYVGNGMDKIMDEVFFLINLPNTILMETDKRVLIYKNMFENVSSKINVLATTNPLKDVFIGILMNIQGQQSLAVTGINSNSPYVTRTQLAWYLDIFNGMGNSILGLLDNQNGYLNFTNSNVNSKDYYGVNPDIVRSLVYLISLIGKSKDTIIQSGLQQRTFVLKQDMALAVLTHYLLGLTDAENIEILNKINNFTFSELIIVPKDRLVQYFV